MWIDGLWQWVEGRWSWTYGEWAVPPGRPPYDWTPARWVGDDRGFTFHEQLDPVGYIHMNGRVYDPLAGRFLSVDAIIGNLSDSQLLNPYAYVGNRPLAFTDPSGYDVVCGGVCAAVVVSVVQTAANFLMGGGQPQLPPATALPGKSPQSGVSLCGPGTFSPTCSGMLLHAGSPGLGASGAPSEPALSSEC